MRDFQLTETAEFWREAPEIERGEITSRRYRHRSFLLSRGGAYRKETAVSPIPSACCSGTHKAIEPPGDCRSELDFIFKLGLRLKQMYAEEFDQPRRLAHPGLDVGLSDGRSAAGAIAPKPCCAKSTATPSADQQTGRRLHIAEGRWFHRLRLLDLFRLLQGWRQSDRPPQAALGTELGRAGMGLGVAAQPPHACITAHRRIRKGSHGRSANAWSGGTKTKRNGPATTSPTSSSIGRHPTGRRRMRAAKKPSPAIDPFIMQADGKGWLFAAGGLQDGPLPTHYEPQESMMQNPLYGQQCNPARMEWMREGQSLPSRLQRSAISILCSPRIA